MKYKKQKCKIIIAILFVTLLTASGFSSGLNVTKEETNLESKKLVNTLQETLKIIKNGCEYEEKAGNVECVQDGGRSVLSISPLFSWAEWKLYLKDFDKTILKDDSLRFGVNYANGGVCSLLAYHYGDKKFHTIVETLDFRGGYDPIIWYGEGDFNMNNFINPDNGEVRMKIINANIFSGYDIKIKEIGIKWNVNYIPEANIKSINPENPSENEEIILKGEGYDQDGDIKEYEWYNGDSKIDDSKTIKVRFSKGDYTIKFRVKDDEGAWSKFDIKDIHVSANKQPVATGFSPRKGKARTEITVTFTANDVNLDKVKFYIEWGDGDESSTNYFINNDGYAVGKATHTYMLEQKYTITVIAIDEHGAESAPYTGIFVSPKTKAESSLYITKILETFPLLREILANTF